jgi:cysteine-rich repeat protein
MGEQCDNGNSTIDDGCSDSCEILNHWECPNNVAGSLSQCNYIPYCGDGKVNQANENCDDGNNISFDGCSSNCSIV